MRSKAKRLLISLLVSIMAMPSWLAIEMYTAPKAMAASNWVAVDNPQVTKDQTPMVTGTISGNPSSMTVYVNGLGYDMASGAVDVDYHPFSHTYTWELRDNKITPPLFAGTYDVIATARISGINVSDLTKDELIIDLKFPSVANVSADIADGAYKSGQIIPVSIKFDEKVFVTPSPAIYLNSHTGRHAHYTSGSGTDTLIFNYTVQDGDNVADLDYAGINPLALNSGHITDQAGNNAVLAFPVPGADHSLGYNKNIVIDTIAPTITISKPAYGEEVSGGTTYQIMWNASDGGSGLNPTSLKLEYNDDSLPDNWIEIASAIDPSLGSYDWNVPTLDGDKFEIRLTALDLAGNQVEVKSDHFTIGDFTAPTITLLGDNPITVIKGGLFADPGAKVTDNYDAPSTILSGDFVDTNTIDNYVINYEATDAAGNAAVKVSRTVKVVAPTLLSPSITVSGSDKTINVSWSAVSGADGYYVYIGTTPDEFFVYKSEKLSSITTAFSHPEGDYGTYYVRVTAVDVYGNESTDSVSKQKSVTLVSSSGSSDTSTTGGAGTTTVTTNAARATVVQPAQAASSDNSVSSNAGSSTSTTDDSQGKIKGEEENSSTSEEEEKVNWTPWIILFILIILAGAATGGYFYWFAGEEEIKESKPKEEVKTVVKNNNKPKSAASGSPKNSKKSKRW